jgi:hypothetical protein
VNLSHDREAARLLTCRHAPGRQGPADPRHRRRHRAERPCHPLGQESLTIKNKKYDRCKEIERILDMRQHREVSPARRWQPWVYFILVAIFVAAWVVCSSMLRAYNCVFPIDDGLTCGALRTAQEPDA